MTDRELLIMQLIENAWTNDSDWTTESWVATVQDVLESEA